MNRTCTSSRCVPSWFCPVSELALRGRACLMISVHACQAPDTRWHKKGSFGTRASNPTKIIAEFETQTTWYLRTSEKPIGRVAGQPRSAPLARKARRARLCTTSHMSSRCYEAVRSKLRRSAGSAGLFPARLSHCMVFRKIPSWDRALDVAYQPPAAQCGHN